MNSIEEEIKKYKGLTIEELQAIRDFNASIERGDDDWQEHFKKVRIPAHAIKATKEMMGADYIREAGYNTELADKEYGPGWLDRED